jgi:flagellar basal-body rod protein FlgG
MPSIEKNWTDYSQGSLQQTSNPLDFAISGRGFFRVSGPNGDLYTRNGSFHVNANGQLVTQDGYTVQGANGNPITLRPDQTVEADDRGNLTQGGQVAGQIQFVSFKDFSELSKQGQTYFRYGGSDKDISVAPGEMQQGKLEASNVPNTEAAVRLVSVMRQFEMLQKAVSIGAEMDKEAVEEVARSGS